MTRAIDLPPRTASAATRSATVMLVVGFVLLSANTRVAFGQIGPLAPAIGLSPGLVTLLGVIPPLGMGLFAPLGGLLRRRLGEERALAVASAVLLLGTLIRGFGIEALVAGTIVISAAIAVINVLIPVLVRKRFSSSRVGTMMGVYSLAMGIGSATTAALLVPVLDGTDSWALALGIAVIPAALALLGTLPQVRYPRATVSTPALDGASEIRRLHPGRTALGWSLAGFFGIQTLLFYTTLAWFPSILIAAGLSTSDAGTQQAILIIGSALGGFSAPVLAARSPRQTAHLVAIIVVCAIGFTGLLVAPGTATTVWSLVIGVGLGSAQALAPMLFVKRGRDHDHVAALAGFAQATGYVVAASGPILAATVHALTGDWRFVLGGCLVLLAVSALVSIRAGRD